MKKFGKYFLTIVLALSLFLGAIGLVDWVTGPKTIKVVSGWQKIQIDGVIPKGMIVIVNTDSNAILPSEDSRSTGYINEGRINFYESMWMITKTPVWVFCPEDYEFLQKKDNFSDECLEKLSDLTKTKQTSISEYFVGHP